MAMKKLLSFYLHHLEMVMLPFQAIIENRYYLDGLRNSRFWKSQIFPLTVNIILISDTIYQYASGGYDLVTPNIYHHIMLSFMPKMFLVQSDVVFHLIYVLIVLCQLFLMFEKNRHSGYIYFYAKHCPISRLALPYQKRIFKVVPSSLETKLIKFHQQFNKLMLGLRLTMNVQLGSAFPLPLLIYELYKIFKSNGQYFPRLKIIFCFFISFFFNQTVIGVYHIGFRFIYQNVLIQIKQSHYFKRMELENRVLRGAQEFQDVYHRCCATMERLLSLTKEIEAFNCFHSKYITSCIVLFGGLGCSIMQTTLVQIKKVSNDKIPFMFPWFFYSSILFPMVYSFNAASSRTIFWNNRLFKKLRQLQQNLLSGRSLSTLQTIKLDLVNEYKLLLQKCSFRLLNSASINNKLFFFHIFGYVSVFYMKLLLDETWR